ncbi:MAG: D-ribose pyranase, partial [Clostridium baratii]
MRKTKLLNSQISSVISEMGHTDTLAIGDCGLPIPKDVKRIDLAIIKNL